MSQKGTKNGVEKEIFFTKTLNKKDDISYWNILGLNPKNNFAVHIVKQKCGTVNGSKVWPKADVFIATGVVKRSYLIKKDYYLDEDDLLFLKLKPVVFSGISVKDPESDKYQITKISPNTFKKIFGENILASGASIYCSKTNEFIKNTKVLRGWGVEDDHFIAFFNKTLGLKLKNVISPDYLNDFQKLKTYSNEAIVSIILRNKKISDFIFFGVGNFDEPFTATWLYSQGDLFKNKIPKFIITTGSGRSKGVFTIVLKPDFN